MDNLTIDKEYDLEIVEQKSRFICFIFPCKKVDEFQEKMKKIKKNYHNADHHVPAFRILNNSGQLIEHFSDDREPSKTAGYPLLFILKQKSLIQIGVIVVRFFGGIKLGTSGLQKTYSKILLDTLENAKIVVYEKRIDFTIKIPIEKEYLFHEFLKNERLNEKIDIIKINYINENSKDFVFIKILTTESIFKLLETKLINKISGMILNQNCVY